MVTRRDFIKKAAVSVSALTAPCALTAGGDQRKPNIILFISDDHGYADSGAYGDTYVRTPNIDGRSFMRVLTGRTAEHRKAVFGTHTGNDNGGPGIANQCPARTIRTSTHRYILNLEPSRTFTTHITGCQPPSPHYLPFWDSWVQKAKTDARAKKLVDAYQHRPAEELYDLTKDPCETTNIADDPQNRRLLESMRKQLAGWRKQQGDTVLADQEGN